MSLTPSNMPNSRKSVDGEFLPFLDAIPTPVRIVRVDDCGIPVYSVFNEAALEADELLLKDIVGKTAKDVYPGLIGETAYKNQLVVVNSKKPLVFEMKNGFQTFQTSLTPAMDENGSVSHIICTKIDITAEKRLLISESSAEIRIREMEQYINMAAHDLRSPMRQVKSLTEFLIEDFEDLGDGKIDILKMMAKMSDNALSLITDVLNHAQATAKRDTVTETFDFDILCTQIFAVLDPLSQNTLVCSPASIVADKVTVQIALTNLVDNALKHNGNKDVKLSIELEQQSTELIRYCITDDGKGFPQSTKEYFETNVLRSESGFGLAGVARMVRAHGGDIQPPSENGSCGGNISFTLPGVIITESDKKS